MQSTALFISKNPPVPVIKMTENLQHLQPPQSLDAEQSLLGCLLRDGNSYGVIDPIVDSEDFYNRQHQNIYEAIRRLNESNKVVDIGTVSQELERAGLLVQVGGRTYLVELMESVASIAAIRNYAEIVREKSMLRETINTCNEAVRDCYQSGKQAEEIIAMVSATAASLLNYKRQKGFVRLGDLARDAVASIDDYQRGKKRGFGTGFPTLDELTGGFQRGDLIVLAGRPGTGKTAFSYNTAAFQARTGYRVAYFSAETKASDFSMRALCTGADVNSMDWKAGRLSNEHIQKVTLEMSQMSAWSFWLCDTPRIEIHSLIAQATHLKAKEAIDLIYVDYGQLLTTRERYRDRREQINYIIQKLKETAKLLDVPVVAISQLSRESVKHRNRPPMLSDLKETGAWEEDADLIISLWKPTPTKKDAALPDSRIIEALILKARNGPTGKVEFYFEKEYTKFSDPNINQGDMPF
jgi:replicative DNA helicase